MLTKAPTESEDYLNIVLTKPPTSISDSEITKSPTNAATTVGQVKRVRFRLAERSRQSFGFRPIARIEIICSSRRRVKGAQSTTAIIQFKAAPPARGSRTGRQIPDILRGHRNSCYGQAA